MFLSETVFLKGHPSNMKYYKSLGYDIKNKEYIEIEINDVSIGSRVIIKCKCDFCGVEKESSMKIYIRNYKNHNMYACKKCSYKKVKLTNLEKYGVEHYIQTEDFKQKSKETNLEKYGVENVFQNEEIKCKIKETNLYNYGVENPSQSEEIKQKKIYTCLKNNGIENPSQMKDHAEKFRKHYGYGDKFTKEKFDHYSSMVRNRSKKHYNVLKNEKIGMVVIIIQKNI